MKMETKTENSDFTCSHYLGYLSQLSGEKETPDECMVCKKLLECKRAKSDTIPNSRASETVVIEKVRQSVEESTGDTAKKGLDEAKEFENVTKPSPIDSIGNQFAVENVGQLYASWSETVLINKETLSGWGAKIRWVDIQTKAGKKMRCKVVPSEDSRKGIVLMPEKIQFKLEIEHGELVSVEPLIEFRGLRKLSFFEPETQSTSRALLDFSRSELNQTKE